MSDRIRINIHSHINVEELNNIHLLTCKILKYKDQKITLCIHDEGYNIVKSGLENIVKEICDYNNIPYSNIEFESGDILKNGNYFKHNYIGYNGDAVRYEIKPGHEVFSNAVLFRYGQFYARPDFCRLYSMYKHLTWQHRLKGLATMHFDPIDNNYKKTIYDFLIRFPNEWVEVEKNLPYTDFGIRFNQSVIDHHNHHNFWFGVYKTIAIEIVSETITTPDSNFITEKTFRPILHHRLFMIIGSPGCENVLKNMGFDIFDDVIDKSYDDKFQEYRIEHMYGSLEHLLKTYDSSIMNKLKSRLEKNNKLMRDFLMEEKLKYERLSQ